MRRGLLCISTVAVAMVAGFVTAANAICTVQGQILEVTLEHESNGLSHEITIREKSRDTFHYRATTKDLNFVNLALAAGKRRVRFIGDADRCPTTGYQRDVGTLILSAIVRQ